MTESERFPLFFFWNPFVAKLITLWVVFCLWCEFNVTSLTKLNKEKSLPIFHACISSSEAWLRAIRYFYVNLSLKCICKDSILFKNFTCEVYWSESILLPLVELYFSFHLIPFLESCTNFFQFATFCYVGGSKFVLRTAKTAFYVWYISHGNKMLYLL